MAEEGGGEGAAGAMDGGGREVFADVPVDFSGRQAKDVGGLGVVAGSGYDVEMGVALGQSMGCGFGFGEGLDGLVGESGELGPVGGDPGDDGEKLAVEGF